MRLNAKIMVFLALAIVLAAALPLAAQQPTQMPYFYVYTSVVKPGMETMYTQAVAAVVEASKKSSKGLAFATYTNFTGDERVYAHFIVMQSLGDMDGWATIDQILADGVGAERAAKVQQGFGMSAATTSRVLRLNGDLSNPGSDASTGPPPMLLWNGFVVAPEHAGEFVAAARQYISVARKNAKAPKAVAYETMLGAEGNAAEFSFFVTMNKWGDMDGQAAVDEVLAAALGADAAAKLRDGVAKIAASDTEILVYLPALSNIPTM